MWPFLLINSLGIAYILEVWLNTDVFYEYYEIYLKSLNINICYTGDYDKLKSDKMYPFPGSYLDFLKEYHNCFFVRLISCATCLSFWFGLFSATVIGTLEKNYNDIFLTLPLAFLNLFFYRLLNKLN